MTRPFLILLFALMCLGSYSQNAWVNEFHYDNNGTDVDEVIEVVIENAGSYTIADFSVYLYSGADGLTYNNRDLGTYTQGDVEGDFTFYYFYYPVNGIQNASSDPDAIALLYQGNLIPGQFLSYEGSFTAVDGPIAGETSVDIGVTEGSTTPIGESLQLTNCGTQYSDFNWLTPATATVGSLNNGQCFCPLCPTNFAAVAVGSDQIDLSWLQNPAGDDVMIAYNTSNTFGTPTDGVTYSVNDPIAGGGTVIYNGSGLMHSHTGLTPVTQYFYQAWSVDGSVLYYGPVKANATTTGVAVVSAGDILITEIMQNPSSVSDSDGEWFEIFNSTSFNIDINGWEISDDGSDSHTISNGGPLVLPAGGFLILGRSSNTSINDGVPVDYSYATSYSLANGADEVVLSTASAVEIARIDYDGGPSWPDPNGKSMIFIGTPSDDNNSAVNWITSYQREAGYTTSSGDDGSPGINGLFQNLITSTTWTGTGNWSEGNPPAGAAANWSNGSPGSEVEVIVDGDVTVDMPIITPALSGTMTLKPGRSLTVDPSNSLIIHGNLTDEGGTFTIETNGYVELK